MSDQPTRPDPADLETRLLGARPVHTREEAAAAAGLPVEKARQLWRALGFADVGDAPVLTDADIAALQEVGRLIETGALDERTVVRLTRALGQTMARLAEWQAEAIIELVERRAADQPGTSRLATAYGLAGDLVPAFERLQAYAWHRHLAAAALRLERLGRLGAPDTGLLASPLTVGFADLVGFTRLSRRLDENALADLVERFEAGAADRVAAVPGARLVKTLGDSVLFVADTPACGLDVALGLIDDVRGDEGMPDLRVGLGTGKVLTRLGDVYGAVVNRAARLTSVARRNRVVVDEPTAAALAGVPGVEIRPMPPKAVRGLGLTESFQVRRG